MCIGNGSDEQDEDDDQVGEDEAHPVPEEGAGAPLRKRDRGEAFFFFFFSFFPASPPSKASSSAVIDFLYSIRGSVSFVLLSGWFLFVYSSGSVFLCV